MLLETAPCISRLMNCWVTTGQVPYPRVLILCDYSIEGIIAVIIACIIAVILPSGASGDGSMHFEVKELLGYYGTGSVPQGVNLM